MNDTDILLERCCTTVEQVREAAENGAGRVELCVCLEVGGVTPPEDLIRDAVSVVAAERMAVNVLVRPRGGDFVYDEREAEQMVETIRACRRLGVDGVVIGALTPEGNVDVPLMRRLMAAAGAQPRRLSVTFHRAFDRAAEPFGALEDVIALGCDRLLTSGQQPTAPEGSELIRRLVSAAAGRIIIMPGSGVTPQNIAGLAACTGAVEFHGTRLAAKDNGALAEK